MIILPTQSHLDHGLTEAQLAHVLGRFATRDRFFIETFALPPDLGEVPCALYGPIVGDAPVASVLCERKARGDRKYESRILIGAKARPSRLLTVIAGPTEVECTYCGGKGAPCGCQTGKIAYSCVLYTAFGGPLAPQEPDDPTLLPGNRAASIEFWAEHALAVESATSARADHTPSDPRIFVFGSNLRGIHAAGAARYANQQLGYPSGVGEGRYERAYAIPTCRAPGDPLALLEVGQAVHTFLRCARRHSELRFYVSAIGCGIAGFTEAEIAPLFAEAPENCDLPPGWRKS